jgi:hypothetical protein
MDINDMDQAEDTIYPVYVAFEDVCQGINYGVPGGAKCKVITADLSPWCVAADFNSSATDVPCEAFGRSGLRKTGRTGSPVGPEYANGKVSECETHKENGEECMWYEETYQAYGSGCFLNGSAPALTTSTSTITTKTVVTTTTTTTVKVVITKRRTATSVTSSTSTMTTATTITSTVTASTVTTSTTVPMEAVTELWNNPLCNGAPAQNQKEQAIKDRCETQSVTPVRTVDENAYFLMVPMQMINPASDDPNCANEAGYDTPCINADLICVHSTCDEARRSIVAAAESAVKTVWQDAADLIDPTTCSEGQGPNLRWVPCKKFGDLPDWNAYEQGLIVKVDFNFNGRRRRNQLPSPKGKVAFNLAIGSKTADGAIRTRLVFDKTTSDQFYAKVKATFVDYKPDSADVRAKWEVMVKDSSFRFFIGDAESSTEDLSFVTFAELSAGDSVFGALPRVNDDKVYEADTPAPIATADCKDDADRVAGEIAENQYDLPNSAVQKQYDQVQEKEDFGGQNEITTMKMISIGIPLATLNGYKATLDEYQKEYVEIEETLTNAIDKQKNDNGYLTVCGQTAEALEKEVEAMEELKIKAGKASTVISTKLDVYSDAVINLGRADSKDVGEKSTIKTGAAVGVLIALLIVMGAVAFLIVQKNRRGKPRRQQLGRPGEQSNPAYEPGNAPQNAPAAQRKPSGGDVIQQGQRKVLVLDPYGDQAPNEA